MRAAHTIRSVITELETDIANTPVPTPQTRAARAAIAHLSSALAALRGAYPPPMIDATVRETTREEFEERVEMLKRRKK